MKIKQALRFTIKYCLTDLFHYHLKFAITNSISIINVENVGCLLKLAVMTSDFLRLSNHSIAIHIPIFIVVNLTGRARNSTL